MSDWQHKTERDIDVLQFMVLLGGTSIFFKTRIDHTFGIVQKNIKERQGRDVRLYANNKPINDTAHIMDHYGAIITAKYV